MFVWLKRLKDRRNEELIINTDDISSIGTSTDWDISYYVEMKNGTRYQLNKEYYDKLKDAL